jgi:hypothetical protein
MLPRWFIGSCLVFGSIAMAGCDQGPKRFHVWGKITYQGQPIPAGTIYFDPDTGNSGQQGIAIIKNGEFDTRKEGGTPPMGGKYVARVFATDGIVGPEMAIGNLIFPERSIPYELPKEDKELNIDVPKQ